MTNTKKFVKKITGLSILTLTLIALLSTAMVPNIANAQVWDEPVPHYFGPYPNFATSQLPTVTTDPNTGQITSVTGGIKKFVDSLPLLGRGGANNLGNYIPIAIADKTTYPGCDYYEIAIVEFEQQMHSNLSATRLRGYVQLETSVNSAQSLHYPLTFLNGTAVLKADGTQAYAVDRPLYLGPTIIADKDVAVRIKFTNFLPTGQAGDLFLPVDTTVMGSGMGPEPMLMPNGMPMLNPDGSIMYESYTQNRATLHLHGGNTPWISDGTTHQWITPRGENTVYPKGVSVQYVPDMWFVNGNVVPNTVGQVTPPVPGATTNPGDGSLTFYYTNQQSARLLFYHDHSYGITRLNVYGGEAAGYLIRDQVEQDLITQGIIPADEIPLIIQDKTFVPDTTTPITNMWGTFDSQLAFQDPTWNIQRWGDTGSLWYPHVYMTMQNPGDPSGMNTFGRWHYAPWFWPPYTPEHPPVANPYAGQVHHGITEPALIPGVPNVSAPGEAFLDTPVVNGVAYPYLDVEPKAYRFRILNAADDRGWNLQLYEADNTTTTWDGRANTEVKMVPANFNAAYPAGWPTDGRDGGVPDPTRIGPSFIQIGNEAGFLPAPVNHTTLPVNWNWDQGTFDFGIVNQGTLNLAAAERADVIVDFSKFAGKTLILYNDNPAPNPAADPRLDYYTGKPDQTDSGGSPTTIAGYGPNTRTVMQIRVGNTAPAAEFDLAALETAFTSTATTEGAFAASQKAPIVPQSAYGPAFNQVYNDVFGTIYDNSLTFTPINASAPVTLPFEAKSMHDEMGGTYDVEYGRMQVALGVEIPKSTPLTQTTILYGFGDSPTELIAPGIEAAQIGSLSDGTQIWRITHNGVDQHPMHWHMFDVQLINRVAWDNNIRVPDANELGWKDTVKINPLQDTYIALRPIVPTLPFDLPNNIRPLDPTMPLGATLKGPGFIMDPQGNPITLTNHLVNFGYEFTWHCHILAHEEMDAMRPMAVAVPPRAPTSATATQVATGLQISWADNSISETSFAIERANDAAFTTGLVSFTAAENATSYIDTSIAAGQTYYYRVKAVNLVGDSFDYSAANPNAVGFPTVQAQSTPSNTASAAALAEWYTIGDTVANAMAKADVDNDGQIEIVTGGHYFDGTRNVAQITVHSASTFALESQHAWYWTGDTTINSIAVANVDADADLEIIAGGSYFDGTRNIAQLTVWSGPTLALENDKAWYWTSNTVINSIAVGNVDADAAIEIVTGGYYSDGTRDIAQLAVWTGSNLAFENVKVWFWTDDTTINSVAIADVDADSANEIVTGGQYFDNTRNIAQIAVWTGSSLALENDKAWYWVDNTTINSISAANVDADAALEIVTGGSYFDNTRNIAQLAVWSGSSLALENVKAWYWTSDTVINSVTAANTDADADIEIITGGSYLDGTGASIGQVATWTGSSLASETVSTWQSGTATYVKAVDSTATGIISAGYFNDGTRLNAQLKIH